MVFDHSPATLPPNLNYGLLIQNFFSNLFLIVLGKLFFKMDFSQKSNTGKYVLSKF